MSIITINELITVETALARIGVELPERCKQPIALHNAVQSAANIDVVADLRHEIENELVDETTVGARVLEVAGLFAAKAYAHSIGEDCRRPLDRLARRTLAGEADNIIRAMRPAFDDAVKHIVAAHTILGATLTGSAMDPHDAAKLGPSAVSAWQSADDAKRVLDNVQRVTRNVFAAVDSDALPGVEAYVADPKNSSALTKLRETYRAGKLVAVITAGTAMHLNTYAETLALIDHEKARVAAAAAAARDEQLTAARVKAETDLRILTGDRDLKLPMRPSGKRR